MGEGGTPACGSFQSFAVELQKVLSLGSKGTIGAKGLLNLQQGYQMDFRTKAHQSDWNLAALHDAFLDRLAECIKNELVSNELPSSLEGVIKLATRVDLRIQARRQGNLRGYCSHHLLHHRSTAAAGQQQ